MPLPLPLPLNRDLFRQPTAEAAEEVEEELTAAPYSLPLFRVVRGLLIFRSSAGRAVYNSDTPRQTCARDNVLRTRPQAGRLRSIPAEWSTAPKANSSKPLAQRHRMQSQCT